MSKLAWSMLAVALFAQHVAFAALCFWLRSSDVLVGLLFLAWIVLPALTGAIVTSNAGRHGIVSAINGLVAGCVVGYLVHVENLFRRSGEPMQERDVGFMFACALGGFAVASICGAFVDIICKRLDSSGETSRGKRSLIGVKKGLTFSAICVLVSLPVLVLLLPSAPSGRLSREEKTRHHQQTIRVVIWYSVAGVIGGSLVGAIVGVTHNSSLARRACVASSTPVDSPIQLY